MGIEQIANIIKDFISKSDPDTIKGWNISPIITNPSKHERFWFSINIQFSTAFDYDEAFISELKGRLCADHYYLNVKNNRLYIHYITFNKPTKA